MNTCGHCDYLSTISKPIDMSAQKKREGIGRCRVNRYGYWLHHSTAACDKFTQAENIGRGSNGCNTLRRIYMAGNSKPRKKMGHRTASYLGGLTAVLHNQRCRGDAAPLPAENQVNVVISYHTAIDAMTGGYAKPAHFDTLVYALDIGVILAERGIGRAEAIRPAMAGLARAKQRYLKTGKFGLDGDALVALKAVAGLHEAQLQAATRGQLAAAIDEMHARIGRKEAA